MNKPSYLETEIASRGIGMRINDNDIAVTQEVQAYPRVAFQEPRQAFLLPVAACMRYSQQLALIPLQDRIQPSLHGA